MSAFKDQLASDADATFLNEDEFAEPIDRLVNGSPQFTEELTAIVDWDREVDPATLNPSADQSRTDQGMGLGRKKQNYCVLEVLTTQEILDDDKFRVDRDGDSVIVNFIREIGRDDALKTLLCVAPGNLTARSPRIRR
jgi:hypothetical protein